MTRRKTVIIGIVSLTAISSTVLLVVGKPAYPVIIIGALTSFIIYGVYAPPEEHKSFEYRDQQRAMRAFDRTDLLNFGIGSMVGKKKRQKKKKS